MKSITSIDALTWLGGLAVQTFLKAFFILLLLNGVIDLALVRNLDTEFSRYLLGGGLAVSLFLAWVFLLWKTEPPILARSILGAVPLLLGVGAFLVTGNWLWWLVVIAGYAGWAIWSFFLRAPYVRTAMYQWKAGNTEQAIGVLSQHIQFHASASEAFQYRAWIQLDRAQFHEAEQDIRTALRLNPRSYFSHYLFGRILLEQGHLSEAKEALQSAVRLGPGRGISYLSLGIIYHLETQPLLAVEALSNSVGWGLPNASNYLVAYYYIGREMHALGQPAQSARGYQLMARYRKGYDRLVAALEADRHSKTPTSQLYRADLSDIRHRLDLEM